MGDDTTALLTLREAIESGIRVLRRDPWVPRGRIELDLHEVGDGNGFRCGPWVTVKDGATDDGVLDPQKILLFDLDMDERVWEPWSGPYEEQGGE